MAQLRLMKIKHLLSLSMDNVHGCRISPNVFTTTEELDALVNAVTELSNIKS